MNLIQSVILSIVEGLSEFLPISSTGHLILVSKLLGIVQTDFVKSYEIIIQLGAILSVLFLFRDKLKNKRLFKNIVISFIPSAVLGLVLYKIVKMFFMGNAIITVLALFIGGIVLIIFEKWIKKKKIPIIKGEELNLKQAVIIGLFQSLAFIPGVSRAASVIVGGMLMGMTREEAVLYSFLLAIPTMFAATLFDVVKSWQYFDSSNIQILTVGFIGSFITATLAVKLFLNFVRKNTFMVFGVYRIIISTLYFIFVR